MSAIGLKYSYRYKSAEKHIYALKSQKKMFKYINNAYYYDVIQKKASVQNKNMGLINTDTETRQSLFSVLFRPRFCKNYRIQNPSCQSYYRLHI